MLKRTPTIEELRGLLPIPKTINEIVYGYLGNPIIITLNVGLEPKKYDKKIIIPLISSSGGFYIDWGDNICEYISSQFNTKITHTYPHYGIYTVHIYGDITKISFRRVSELVEISQWGCLRLCYASGIFTLCKNLTMHMISRT